MRRATIIGVVSFCLWAGLAPDATACRCFGGPVCIAASRSDAVFIGRVTRSSFSEVWFEVERAFMGVEPGTIGLANGPGNCNLQFTVGDRYFVYASRTRDSGVLTTGMCTRTRPLSDAHTRADIAWFTHRQRHKANPTLLTGVVSDVRIDLAAPIAVPHRPLAGIKIVALPVDGGPRRTATTRADGSYELIGIPAGRWSITANLPERFEPREPASVMIQADRGCAEADIGARIDGRISGQLLDERGEPLRRVGVHLADPIEARAVKSPLRTIDAVTDEDGRFEFRYVGPGRYVVGVNLQTPLRPGVLNRRRFYGDSLDPATATVVQVEAAERRQLPPFRLPPLPADRLITIVVHAPTSEVARETTLFLTSATREPIAQIGNPLTLRLPFGASYSIEAVPPTGSRIIQSTVRIASDDTDKTIEFTVEKKP
jgi:hypothetical protein